VNAVFTIKQANNITKVRTDRFIQRVVLSVIAGVEGGMLVSFILLKGLF